MFVSGGALIELSPSERIEFFSDGSPCSLIAEGGAIGSVVGLGGDWSCAVEGVSWYCDGTAPWGIGSGSLDCGEIDSSCDPSGGGFGIESDSDSISASMSCGPGLSSVSVRCEFLLAYECCVSYQQNGGSYCDVFASIDGIELPRPWWDDVGCLSHEGKVRLSAGWHVLSAGSSDFGDGTFSLQFSSGDCGVDCDANGIPDQVEVSWSWDYGWSDLDLNGNGWLDACEGPEFAADLSNDLAVDAADVKLLLSEWGGEGRADLDGDGVVGPTDLALLLSYWGPLV